MRNGHVALRRQVSYPNLDQMDWRGRERRKKEQTKERGKCGIFREIRSTLSLEFPAIGPASPDEARSKVAPHGKDYTWVPVLGEFRQTPER